MREVAASVVLVGICVLDPGAIHLAFCLPAYQLLLPDSEDKASSENAGGWILPIF